MARTIGVTIEDVGGSFAKFIKTAPAAVKLDLQHAVRLSAFAVGQRMKALAPVGPDAPHIREDVEVKMGRGLTARVGYFGGTGDASDQPHIALYNEFRPNKRPFMRPAAQNEAGDFTRRVTDALKRSERALSVGRLA